MCKYSRDVEIFSDRRTDGTKNGRPKENEMVRHRLTKLYSRERDSWRHCFTRSELFLLNAVPGSNPSPSLRLLFFASKYLKKMKNKNNGPVDYLIVRLPHPFLSSRSCTSFLFFLHMPTYSIEQASPCGHTLEDYLKCRPAGHDKYNQAIKHGPRERRRLRRFLKRKEKNKFKFYTWFLNVSEMDETYPIHERCTSFYLFII